MTTDSKAATWISDAKTEKIFDYFFDLGYSAMTALCLFMLKVYLSFIMSRVQKRMKYARNYTLEIKGVPYINHENFATED